MRIASRRFGKIFGPSVLWLAIPALALNPIHEAGYALWPREPTSSDWRAEAGGIFSGGESFEAPLALALGLTPDFEIGVGLKTAWGDVGDHIPFLPVGLKFGAAHALALNLDLLVATRGGGHGLRAGMLKRMGHGRRLTSRLSIQMGFLDALADRDGMALEGLWIPSLRLGRGLSLECGVAASSQFPGFNDHFALDLQPALFVGLGGGGGVLSQVTVGLAGERREDLRVKIAWAQGF